jgi:hypothetical protein
VPASRTRFALERQLSVAGVSLMSKVAGVQCEVATLSFASQCTMRRFSVESTQFQKFNPKKDICRHQNFESYERSSLAGEQDLPTQYS